MRFKVIVISILISIIAAINNPLPQIQANDLNLARIVSMTPTSGCIGDPISFICTNLYPRNPHDVIARFNFKSKDEISAEIVSIQTLSNTNIILKTTIPKGVHSGPVVLEYLIKLEGNVSTRECLSAGNFKILTNQKKSANDDGDALHGSPIGGRPSSPNQSGPGSQSNIPKYDLEMDLPVEKPVFGKPAKAPDPPKPTNPIPEIPPTIYGKDLKSESGTIFYVIDISGSMGWEIGQYVTLDGKVASGHRLDRAKVELIRSILTLPKSFKFTLLAYDCSVYVWNAKLVPAIDQNKKSAIEWINELKPQGATGTGPATVQALQIKENKLLILLTDGAPNCGAGNGQGDWSCMEAHLSQIHWANTQHARIDVFGISATSVFKQFCLDVASQNGGSYTDVR